MMSLKVYRTEDELAYMRGILQTLKIEGDLAEIGVYLGGSAKVLKEEMSDRKLHLFDTFEGIMGGQILSYEKEIYQAGLYRATIQEVKKNLGENKIFYHIGDILETKDEVKDEKFCFIHIDLDIYIPLKGSLDFFYDRLVENGVLLISNYDNMHLGVKRAVDEFGKSYKKYSRFVFIRKWKT